MNGILCNICRSDPTHYRSCSDFFCARFDESKFIRQEYSPQDLNNIIALGLGLYGKFRIPRFSVLQMLVNLRIDLVNNIFLLFACNLISLSDKLLILHPVSLQNEH